MKAIYLLFFFLLCIFACQPEIQPETAETPAKKLTPAERRLPENALAGLSASPGLEAQLFAAEPLVRNPSNIDVDHRGRVWVVENVNYRPENNPDNEYQEGGDMVVILEDTDGDGQADDRKVFYQDLLVDGAMGIGVFGNRVYLSSSPHILILTDEDMDDRADKVDTLFTGMGHKQGDHTVHAVSFGPDGRLYFNYGNASPEMLYKDGSPVTDKMGNVVNNSGNPYRQGMVFRCEMDGSDLESLGHNFRNNYEVCVDSYGRMWQSDNDDDGNKAVRINYVMEYGNFGYRDELTGASWQTGRSGMHPEIPSRHWRQNDPGVVPNLYITGSGSPCGITLYEGNLLPKLYQEQLIHADAGPGVVRAICFQDAGAGFEAKEVPMLKRQTDAWYRPTDVSVAPDGSVIASDWYDPGVGGHWAADALRGRLFRITTSGAKNYKTQQLSADTPEAAIEALKSPNAASRYLAWTALEQFGQKAEAALTVLWKDQNPVYRARALWLLARINESHLKEALKDKNEKIRSTAIRAARQLYPRQLVALLQPMLTDDSPKVRREIAIALREMAAPEVSEFWATLAMRHDGKDRWYLEALGIAATGRWDACFQTWINKIDDQWDSPAGRDIIWRSRSSQTFSYLTRLLEKTDVAASEQARYLRASDFLENANKDPQFARLLVMERTDKIAFQQMLLTHISPEFARASMEVRRAVTALTPQIRGTKQYLDIVKNLNLQEEIPHLFQMVVDKPNHESGVAAAQLLLEMDGWRRFEQAIKGEHKEAMIKVLSHINQGTGKALLKEVVLDEEEESATREKALEAMSLDWGWERRLLDLLENEKLPDELIALAASKLLGAARGIDRAQGIKYLESLPEGAGGLQKLPSIEEMLAQNGDVASGREIFSSYCSACHQVNGLGVEFGPNLSEIANKLGPDALYSSIIYPSAAISHGFEAYHFELKDGTHRLGYILSENQGQIALKIQNGSTQTFLESEVKTKEALSNSLMTAGLAHEMGEEKLVDLVAYLSSLTNEKTMASNPFQGKIEYERED